MFQMRTLSALALTAVGVAAASVLPSAPFSQEEWGAPEPTKEHELLLKSVGEWEGTMKSTMPGMDPMEMPATETVTALGPFHTYTRFSADFFGQPFEGMATTSYDPKSKEVVNTWMDNGSMHTSIMRGTIDPKTGRSELRWRAPMPGVGDDVAQRSVTEYSGDSYVMTFFMGEGDEQVEYMTLSMKRKK